MDEPVVIRAYLEGVANGRNAWLRALHYLEHTGMLETLACTYLAEASFPAWEHLLNQVAALDLDLLTQHRAALADPVTRQLGRNDVTPIPLGECRRVEPDDVTRGREMLSRGEVAAVVFAGGAATRFFSQRGDLAAAFGVEPRMMAAYPPDDRAPKGAYPVTPVLGKSFIWRLAEQALATAVKVGVLPPLLFMTSNLTHEGLGDHLAFIAAQTGYPLTSLDLRFCQGMLPRLDDHGCLLAQADTGGLVFTGDGHGGVFRALQQTQPGVLAEAAGESLAARLENLGVKHLFIGNVDNTFLAPFDPGRLGVHGNDNALFTASLVARRDEDEKVGVPLRTADGRVTMVEYSELSAEVGRARAQDGGLLIDCAHINSNVVALEAIATPFAYSLYTGKMVLVNGRLAPASSFERLNQNMVRELPPQRVVLLALPRERFFIATKAVRGTDSMEETVHRLGRDGAALLEAAGARVEGDTRVEVSCLLGEEPSELVSLGVGQGWIVGRGAALYLGAVKSARPGRPPYSPGLVLEEGSSLVVHAKSPLGRIVHDFASRRFAADDRTAGRVWLGRDVRVKAGVCVEIYLESGQTWEAPDGAVFDRPLRSGRP